MGGAMLEDVAWILESYGEPGNLTAVIADTKITAEFVSADETLKGSAGCNSYFGSYELKGSQLSIPGPIAATEMYCMEPKGVMDQEQQYLAILQLAERYEIDDHKLTIYCDGQVLIYRLD
jgi:heat shock protein HslJ